VNNDESRAYLAGVLDGLAAADPSLPNDATLTEWYLIAVHQHESGAVFSRYSAPGQEDWTDMGLLRLASTLDEQEIGGDREDDR
jgi:hypothetical protein